jgi:hypothetical protein
MQSRKVLFTTTAALVNELIEVRDDRTLSMVVARYAKGRAVDPRRTSARPAGAGRSGARLQVLDERWSCPS